MGKLSKAFEKSEDQADRGKSRPAKQHPAGKGQSGWTRTAPPPEPDAGFARERWDMRLQISTDPKSGYFESFRRLRSSIVYPSSGRPPRTILVTSTVPHEGKGFVCANLGVALARGMENYAMMVDCDFRNPTLAELFGVSNETGLTDHLREQVDLSLLIRKTGQSKLSLLPSGQPPKNPAELLSSARMEALIGEMAGRYPDRLVLFDSPPDVIASETGVLAKRIDGVILVVRHGASRKEDIKKFVEALGRDKIYGVVFNAFPENTMEDFLERRMGYSYGYHRYSYKGY
ncbi:MAG: polysaccharide biosynthesis tyrosine autokinase [Desulfobacterales bacterium]